MKNKMDNIEKFTDIYKEIYKLSAVIYVFIIQIYILFFEPTSQIIDFSNMIDNKYLIQFLAFIIKFIVFSIIYLIIFQAINKLKTVLWIYKNKNLWLRGQWLHIHKKDDNSVRIGMVTIKQYYTLIEAQGVNYSYPIKNGENRTDWEYYLAQINQEKRAGIEPNLIGCYCSKKYKKPFVPKNEGLHKLRIVERDNKTRQPTMLMGHFFDTFQLENNTSNAIPINDEKKHFGDLFLYRMDDKLMMQLIKNGKFQPQKINFILKNREFAEYSFVKDLKNIL